ncbi:hypothetical protein Tco_0014091 [Tanacetum coccineum]
MGGVAGSSGVLCVGIRVGAGLGFSESFQIPWSVCGGLRREEVNLAWVGSCQAHSPVLVSGADRLRNQEGGSADVVVEPNDKEMYPKYRIRNLFEIESEHQSEFSAAEMIEG